jgi:hypothetical protein
MQQPVHSCWINLPCGDGLSMKRTTAWEAHYENRRSRNQRKLLSLCICRSVRDFYPLSPASELNRRLREKGKTPNPSPNFYSVTTGFIGTGLNWLSWLLSAYVAQEFGIANGVLFFILGMGTSIIANIFIPRLPGVDQVGHVISIPATILFRAVYERSAFRPVSKSLAQTRQRGILLRRT